MEIYMSDDYHLGILGKDITISFGYFLVKLRYTIAFDHNNLERFA